MNRESFIKQLSIDPYNLDEVCSKQAELFAQVAENAVRAKAEAKKAKIELEELEARKSFSFRENGLPNDVKQTEASLKEAVMLHSKVQDSKQELLRLEEEADLWKILQDAYEHRRSMINNEIELWKLEHWGDVGGEREDMKAKWERMAKNET